MNAKVCTPVWLGFLALAACGDPLASPEYPGESLLTVKGSLVVADGVTIEPGIVPVLTWYMQPLGDKYFSSVRVQDVAVRGEFPGKFELSVHEPPAEEVLASSVVVRGFEDEPRLFIGYIGALPHEHEPEVVVGFSEGSGGCVIPESDEPTTCDTEYCDYYGQCFTQTLSCNREGDCEEVASTGSNKVRYGLGVLSGLVGDAAIIYLDGPAQAGSYTAWRLGVTHLDAGFHLIRFAPDEPAASSDTLACIEAATRSGDERFRTAYADRLEAMDDDATGDDTIGDPEGGASQPIEDIDQWDDYELYVAQSTHREAAVMGAGCDTESSLGVIVADVSERITMTFDDEPVLGR